MNGSRHPVPGVEAAEPPLFAARLDPHRSLSRRGFAWLMAFAAVPCLLSGVVFALAGAWPVSGFFGLDFAALAIAFLVNYRAGRAREEVALWRHELLVRKYRPGGRFRDHRFNPFWARLRISRHDAVGVTRLLVTTRNREVPVGDFLNPPDRQSFADAFGAALRQARTG
jgi:uncharacterized membrane protein